MTNPMLAELDEVVRQLHSYDDKSTKGVRLSTLSESAVRFLRTHHATLADMAKDAARYRWLRNHRLDFIVRNNSADPRLSLPMGTDLMEPSAADACIDAAIDATQEGEG